MKNTVYYKSGKHKQNILNAQVKAKDATKKLKALRVDKYYKSPTLCKYCQLPIEYARRKNQFCSHSCSAKLSNRTRDYVPTIEHKLKTSNKLKGRKCSKPKNKILFSRIQFKNCKCCQKIFYVKNWQSNTKQTCSPKCATYASTGSRPYQNGRRKLFTYYNKYQSQNVLLESSWELELAQWMDLNNVEWIRPAYILWYDEHSQKTRLYYPDFYLPKHNLYLDPKNPYGMKRDKYKMSQVSQIIDIFYGDINYLKKMVGVAGF